MIICDKCNAKEEVENFSMILNKPDLANISFADLCPKHMEEAKALLRKFVKDFKHWLEL